MELCSFGGLFEGSVIGWVFYIIRLEVSMIICFCAKRI